MSARRVINRIRAATKAIATRCCWRIAPYYRRVLSNTRFIGITGSGGKTTTKDLIYEVLKSKFRAHKSFGSRNDADTIARTMLQIRPGVAYHVQELGAGKPGALDRGLPLLAPSIAVVTNVRSDHVSAYKDEDEIAHEKGKLVRALGPNGIAILNADDERVLAMSASVAGTVMTFGTSPTADLRAEQIVSVWPEGLRFVLHHRGESFAGSIALHGTHQIHCVLAAVAVGLAAGVTIPEALAAIGEFGPRLGRMSIQRTRRGVTFIRDDWKSPLWSIQYPIDFLATVPARRKLLVLGTISDYRGNRDRRYRDTVQHALEVVDEVIMVGDHASKAERIAKRLGSQAVRGFYTVEAAAQHVLATAAAGDVVLLKGPNTAQHLGRIALAFDRDVRCWRSKCGRQGFCDDCSLLSVPATT